MSGGFAWAMLAAAVVVILASCSSTPHPQTVTVVKVERCPVVAPDVQCPQITDASEAELEDAYVYCREAVRAWQEEWEDCSQ